MCEMISNSYPMFAQQSATLYCRLMVTVMLCNAMIPCATCSVPAAIGRTPLSSTICMGYTVCASGIRVLGTGVSEVAVVRAVWTMLVPPRRPELVSICSRGHHPPLYNNVEAMSFESNSCDGSACLMKPSDRRSHEEHAGMGSAARVRGSCITLTFLKPAHTHEHPRASKVF